MPNRSGIAWHLAGCLLATAPLVAQPTIAGRWDHVRLTHDAIRYDIAVTLRDSGGAFAATIGTDWRSGGPGPLALDLDSVLTVRRATVNGAAVRWQREGNQLVLPIVAAAGTSFRTEVQYDGTPTDGLVIRGSGATRTIFADNWPDRARHWLAVQDHPADKAIVHWQIDAPAGFTVVANGRLESTASLANQWSRWQFLNPEPIPTYTMVVGMARMAVTRQTPNACARPCVPVSVYTYPQDSATALNGAFRRAREMVEFFSGLIAPFPYAELRHVETSTIFGGMENSTVIFYDEKAIHAGRMSEGTVAHETAHQWFGDAVTEADWHHIWLSEGFATYGAALWAEHVHGDSGLRSTMQGARRSVLASAVSERPILDSLITDRMKLLNTNAYPKGSWVLHTLRGMLGDSAFFRGLRTYYRTYLHGNALSSDFARVMSAEAKVDLDWYFQQALLQPGFPVLEATTALEGGHLVLTIRQVQKEAWGVFRMPQVKVSLGDRVLTVDVTGRETKVATHWTGDRPPARIEIDPDGWWLFQMREGQ